jgi:alpha-tubulin suppressor-like RCC1 family protein
MANRKLGFGVGFSSLFLVVAACGGSSEDDLGTGGAGATGGTDGGGAAGGGAGGTSGAAGSGGSGGQTCTPIALESIEAGAYHICGIDAAGKVWCWGDPGRGALGQDADMGDEPLAVALDAPAIDLGLGWGHTCAVLDDGRVACWGRNSHGQLGDGGIEDRSTPEIVEGVTDAVAVSASDLSTCALNSAGEVFCWGGNWIGQLGNGNSDQSNVPTKTQLTTPVTGIASGQAHTCAWSSTGTWCWGMNHALQVSPEVAQSHNVPKPVALTGVLGMSLGYDFTCALLGGGGVQCFGESSTGRLGDGVWKSGSVATPTSVINLDSVEEIESGAYSTCARRANGDVQCWGWNEWATLGTGDLENTNQVTTAAATDIEEVASGLRFTCGRHTDGSLECWGELSRGQALSMDTVRLSPTPITGASFELGNVHACRLDDPTGAGSVSCWGSDVNHRLGLSTNSFQIITEPKEVMVGARLLDVGESHSCAIKNAGDLWCWGLGFAKQLGAPTIGHLIVPTHTMTFAGQVDQIALGWNHSCARLATGAVWCWGANQYAQTAAPPNGDGQAPHQVPGITTAAELRLGYHHGCARTADGAVWCWGLGTAGQLGHSQNANSAVPVKVAGISAATAIGMGGFHSCAVENGRVYCWGQNSDSGQLGVGNYASANTPVLVPDLMGAVLVVAGERHTCALDDQGEVWCWGDGSNGVLGTGDQRKSLTPVKIPGLSGVTALEAHELATCATLSDGSVRCWGSNQFGLLRDSAAIPDLNGTAVALQNCE